MRNYDSLAQELLLGIESILQTWLPDGKRAGHEYKALNPTRSDKKIGSFSINLQNGKWSDFADGASGGNLITLYAYLFGCKNSEAYDALVSNSTISEYARNAEYTKVKNEYAEDDEWEVLPLPQVEPSGKHFELGYPIAKYKYENFYIMRYLNADGSKDIRPLTYRRNIKNGIIMWKWKGVPFNRALYHKELIRDLPILIVEGEKAGNVKVEGYSVVSWAGGSNTVKKTDWSPLQGRNDVYIWADRDEAGYHALLDIKEFLPLAQPINIDFSVEDCQDIADITHEEIQNKLKFVMPQIPVNEEQKKVNRKEIVIDYYTQYPQIIDIETGVTVARTGSGKTFQYENKPNIMILVPRTIQANVLVGDDADYLLNQTFTHGSIVTYNKFYGHYTRNTEFKELIDSKEIKIIVDEAHILLSIAIQMHKVIYNLDAVFMSGTVEKFFRPDLQRYKYRPVKPEIIYYTNHGELPKIDGSLIFVENAKAIEQNYSNCCVTSTKRKHKNVDINTTQEPYVYATSALREGVSIKNTNFKACMVYSKTTSLWSTKDIIQAVHRVRLEDTLRIVSEKPKEQYTKFLSIEWWKSYAEELMTNEIDFNAVFGEFYSNLIKTSAGVNHYKKVDNYGIACYLAYLTRNNYDSDFYNFKEYKGTEEILKIDLKTSQEDEEEEEKRGRHTMSDGTLWEYPESNKVRFHKWSVHYESGLIYKMAKMNEFINFKKVYTRSRIAQDIKTKYNKVNKRNGKKYSIDMFYKLVLSLVKIEMIDKENNKIKYKSKSIDYADISIKVVGLCPLDGVKIV